MSTEIQSPTSNITSTQENMEPADHWLATFDQNIATIEQWLSRMDEILASPFPDAKVLRLSSRDITMVLSEATAQLRQSSDSETNNRYLALMPRIKRYIERSDVAMKQSDARAAASLDENDIDIGAQTGAQEAALGEQWIDNAVVKLTAITNAYNEKFKQQPELLPIFLEQQKMLLSLTIELISLRYEHTIAQPPPPPIGPVDSNSGSGDDGKMEARISALEKDMSAVKTDVAVIRSNYATKEDLHRELHAATWKIIGAITILVGAVFYLARTPVLASPPTQQVSTPPPMTTPEQPKSADQIPH